MTTEGSFLVDVGMRDLPFPIRVLSRSTLEGQPTIADISISARIMHEFEARWIDTFIQVVHQHRERIGTATLVENIVDYVDALQASTVTVTFEFPFFYEKTTPVSREQCLVRYMCAYTVKAHPAAAGPRAILRVDVPVLTTYPASAPGTKGGLFGQLSKITIDVEPRTDMFPEDLIDLADRHALAPIYSFLTDEDQAFLIQTAHTEYKPSVVVLDGIRDELARNRGVAWYSVRAANYGMLHPYSTLIGTEKSMWVPFSGYETDEI
ncbi:MAG: GTP cyclohydrolase I FolE2 [Thermoleophilia bacterium]|nr:GTP cyclohydrolase I FolE2 [Thermoleophilia bacterium]